MDDRGAAHRRNDLAGVITVMVHTPRRSAAEGLPHIP
jgi:hypothetical protein